MARYPTAVIPDDGIGNEVMPAGLRATEANLGDPTAPRPGDLHGRGGAEAAGCGITDAIAGR